MRNLTIHWKGNYWNYDNVENISFYDSPASMSVWTIDGKYTNIYFCSKEETEQVAKRLEEGLINEHVFIELGD